MTVVSWSVSVVESPSVVDVCWFNVVVVNAASVVVVATVVCVVAVAASPSIDHHDLLIDSFIHSFTYYLNLSLKPDDFIYYLIELRNFCNMCTAMIVKVERLTESPEFLLNWTILIYQCHMSVKPCRRAKMEWLGNFSLSLWSVSRRRSRLHECTPCRSIPSASPCWRQAKIERAQIVLDRS